MNFLASLTALLFEPVEALSLDTLTPFAQSDCACFRCAETGLFIRGGCLLCSISPFVADRVFSLFVYDSTAKNALVDLKYRKRLSIAYRLGKLLAQRAPSEFLDVDYIIRVPSAPSHIRARGFDHTAVIAGVVAKQCKGRLSPFVLRARPRELQATLSLAKRYGNVENSFYTRQNLSGARVLLIDDTLTTGATLDAASTALRHAGAQTVFALTLFRSSHFKTNRLRLEFSS